ncbi:MAG: hypothetical protein WDM92_03040 [Caulobacteraceae bacterium]
MAKLPPIPPEPRSFSADPPRDRLRSAQPARRHDLDREHQADERDVEARKPYGQPRV